jgi:hypothetical protein
MLIMKLALWTCAFYLLLALLMELALFVFLNWKGDSVGVFFRWWGWATLFGAVWLISFSGAFYIVLSGIRAKLPR